MNADWLLVMDADGFHMQMSLLDEYPTHDPGLGPNGDHGTGGALLGSDALGSTVAAEQHKCTLCAWTHDLFAEMSQKETDVLRSTQKLREEKVIIRLPYENGFRCSVCESFSVKAIEFA